MAVRRASRLNQFWQHRLPGRSYFFDLGAHQVRKSDQRLVAGGRWRDSGLVLASTIGTPLESSNVTGRLQARLEWVEIPRQWLHDLRHRAASLDFVRRCRRGW